MNADQARIVVNEIFSLYESYGAADYIGEPVSQIEHMCQAHNWPKPKVMMMR